jgi:hypothetical protein
MLVMKRRSRMVSIRLSDQEYDTLKNACASAGARSVSDVARDAILQLVAGNGTSARIESQMDKLRWRMEELEGEVKRLGRLVEGS